MCESCNHTHLFTPSDPQARRMPSVFRATQTTDYLAAAKETATWIRAHERPTANGKLWDVFPEGQNGFGPDVMIFGHRCLYSGAAGIGTFFLRMYEATGDESYLADARAAADELIATATGPEWYDATLNSDVGGVIPVPGWAIGYSNGPVGEGLLALDLFAVTNEVKYRREGRRRSYCRSQARRARLALEPRGRHRGRWRLRVLFRFDVPSDRRCALSRRGVRRSRLHRR